MPVKKKTIRKKQAIKRKPVKKKVVKKPVRKIVKKVTRTTKPAKKPKRTQENIIGVVTHYFPKPQAAVLKLKAPVTVGDTLKFKGHTTDFIQAVTSIQINHVPVQIAKKGQEIGLQVSSRVREHDVVYKA